MFLGLDGVPHLRARGTSVSRLARSAVVTLSAGEMKFSLREDSKTGLMIKQENSRLLQICQRVQGVHGDQQGPLGQRKRAAIFDISPASTR